MFFYSKALTKHQSQKMLPGNHLQSLQAEAHSSSSTGKHVTVGPCWDCKAAGAAPSAAALATAVARRKRENFLAYLIFIGFPMMEWNVDLIAPDAVGLGGGGRVFACAD